MVHVPEPVRAVDLPHEVVARTGSVLMNPKILPGEGWSWSDVVRALLMSLCIVPLVWVPVLLFPHVTPKGLLFQSGVALATTVLLWLVATRRPQLRDPRDPILWGLLVFVGIAAISSSLGSSPHYSFFGGFARMWGLTQWMALVLFYILLRTFFRESDWRPFLRCTMYVAIGVALYGGFEFAIRDVISTTLRTDSTLGNAGYLGGYLLLSVGTALTVLSTLEKLWARLAVGVAVALFVPVMFLTGTRSALIGLLFGSLAVLGLLGTAGVRRESITAKWLVAGVATAVVGAGVVYVLAPVPITRVPGLVRMAETGLDSSDVLRRLEMWEAAFRGARARPVLGWGLENFSLAFDRFVDPAAYRYGQVRADRAHNALLDKLVQTGPLGLLSYLAFWATLVGLTLRGWWNGKLRRMETAGLLVAFVGYFVFLQMWFEDHSSAIVLITLAAYLRHRLSGEAFLRFEEKGRPSRPRAVVWGAVCLVLVAGVAWMGGRSALAAHHMYRGTATVNLSDRIQNYERARRLSPPHQRQVAVRYALSMAGIGLAGGTRLGRSDSLRTLYQRGVAGAERALNGAAARNPMSSRIDAFRGRLAAGASAVYGGEQIKRVSVESMQRAIAKSPPLLAYHHFLARVHALSGDRSAAARALRETLRVYDGYGRTYYLMAQVSGGEVDEEDLRYLRQAFWLGFRPEDRSDLRRVVDALVERGRPDRAERLLSLYFASHYLPSLRVASDPYREERRQFFGRLDADVAPPGQEYRSYEIQADDLTLLARWPRAAMAAGECRRATLAMRLLMNGLSERPGTARIRPTLARQLAGMQEDCRARSREPSRVDGGAGGA